MQESRPAAVSLAQEYFPVDSARSLTRLKLVIVPVRQLTDYKHRQEHEESIENRAILDMLTASKTGAYWFRLIV
jgi:hypothetical protein